MPLASIHVMVVIGCVQSTHHFKLLRVNWAGQPLSHPDGYPPFSMKKLHMEFEHRENVETESWLVTTLGCLAFAALFALALFAV